MTLSLFWSDKCKRDCEPFIEFAQMMANRLMVGRFRYGAPKKEQRYMSRLAEELKTYKRTGNMENLINIANYAWLESQAPENGRFHFDSTAPSATRKAFGGARE